MKAYALADRGGISWVCAALVILSACANDSPQASPPPGAIIHPIPDLKESERTSAPVNELVSSSIQVDSVGRSGSVRSLGSEVDLGKITAATVNSLGEIAALDESYGSVRIFDVEGGERAQTFGRYGAGPGEFMEPVGLTWHTPDSLLIADRSLRIHVFGRTAGGFAFARAIDLDIPPEDICGSGRNIILQGPPLIRTDEGLAIREVHRGTVQALDGDGRVVQSFGVPYYDDNPRVFRVFGSGRVTCDRNGRTWVAYGSLGEIHAFDEAGDLLWVSRIRDLSYPRLVLTGSRMSPEWDGVSPIESLTGIVLVDSAHLAVTVESGRPGVLERTRQAFLLDPSTGRAIARFPDLSVVGGGDGWMVVYHEDPVPRLRVATMSALSPLPIRAGASNQPR